MHVVIHKDDDVRNQSVSPHKLSVSLNSGIAMELPPQANDLSEQACFGGSVQLQIDGHDKVNVQHRKEICLLNKSTYEHHCVKELSIPSHKRQKYIPKDYLPVARNGRHHQHISSR